ncbi:MAG TPA: histidine--tRNA ligase [Phaeodactylibacter sp.]|nr:histidine--tRNA ligase [Phaeodactylibacter sp.]
MKPSLPKGTRDFGPQQMLRRNYLFGILRGAFERYGFQPLETPAMENLSTLTGKYGEEGDKLLFKILNNGDYLAKADQSALQALDSRKLTPSISKRGLRYDLTVPFARYVVMHRHELAFPFKRYQIQAVWRADRPQRGRYQEFYQCDADVVGSDSLMYEAELAGLYDYVFDQIGLPVQIRINNRKLLYGLAEACGITDRFTEMTVAIDKLDKTGPEGVQKEMEQRGIPAEAAAKVLSSIAPVENSDTEAQLANWKQLLSQSETGLKGLAELEEVFAYAGRTQMSKELIFDPTLARGLSYYTGCIFEVNAIDANMGSLGGGGRYDDLTGLFGLKGVSGVGISFGAERIYDLMEEKGLFPENLPGQLQLLLIALDADSHKHAFELLQRLRKNSIACDLYPEPAKLKKQMKYANALKVPKVLIIGSEEMKSGVYALKDMSSGEQQKCSPEALPELFSKKEG